ncbi:MAG: alpha/beta fold hydrolase [Hyphomicrobiaceae bacterium]|nr:alpha/beta fold hydrolase [Hyphomicrobiaceae bacterium]
METVSFFSEGVRLDGSLFRPHDAKAGEKRPAVVLCHGYTGVRDLYLPDAARALTAAGYVALTFDYKGWGTSDGPPRRLDPYGRVADTQAAMTFLAAQPGVDPGRIGLFGWSFGGATVIWTATFDRRARCVVSVVGVGDGPEWFRSVRNEAEWAEVVRVADEDRHTRLDTGHSRMVDRSLVLWLDPASQAASLASRKGATGAANEVPAEFIDETMGFRPQLIVGHLAPTPLLLVTTDRDQVVPPVQSERLHAAAGEPKRLVTLAGFGHYDVYAGEAFRQTMAETLGWFAEHL